jgi:UDPglucose--hexose-1-phosphate uridylyltransferase
VAEIRRDLVKNNWVAITEDMALKPHDFPINKRGIETTGIPILCPFCEGHESSTPPEILAYREDHLEANSPGWSIRVIPNKFSVFHLQGILEKRRTGIYSNYNGVGRQEIIIEIPEHGVDIHDYDKDRIAMIFRVLKGRYNELSQDDRIKYIQVYKNRGIFAGASQEHSHSQIMALPFVPRGNSGVIDYYKKNTRCLICDIIEQEKKAGLRVIYESDYFLVICPYASRFSYETWVIPKQHCEHLGSISDTEISDLAGVFKIYSSTMMDCLQNPAYNLVFNTAPVNVPYKRGFHWYMEITPRLLVTAGVDIATGIYMNPVAPELAAELFREKIKELI